MSKKARYSKELKLEIVKRYLNGESPLSLANEYGLSTSGKVRIWRWSNKQINEFYNLNNKKDYFCFSKL